MAGNNKAEDEKQGCSLEDYKQYLVPAEKRKYVNIRKTMEGRGKVYHREPNLDKSARWK